jgi:8-oxo-dGTP diphosphatase
MRIVTAGIIRKDNAYLIAKRKAGGDLSGKWEFPGGKVKPGEDEREGLVRELEEELAITVTVGEFLCGTRFQHNLKSYELHAYFVEIVGGTLTLLEHDEIRWVGREDFDLFDFADSDQVIVKALRGLSSRD